MVWSDNGNLVSSILSMDAYNRGYDAGIDLIDLQLGSISIGSDSIGLGNRIVNNETVRVDESFGFYSLSYDLGGGQTIISYRGTDQPPTVSDAIGLADLAALFAYPNFAVGDITVKLANNIDSLITPDVWNGWFIAGGAEESAQALLAFEFYKDVVGGHDNIYSANVSLTGHSLGGGLAGLVGGAYGKDATMFHQMPF